MVVRNDIDSTSAILRVSISKENLEPRIKNDFKAFRQKAQIKGFRTGQAPPEFVKKIYGSSILSNALQDMFNDELIGYLRDNKINVLGQPLPTEEQQSYSMKFDKLDDEYSVNYEIGFVPDFDLKGMSKSDTYERLTVSDLDDLAESDIEAARKRMGSRTNPEDGIQAGDMVRIAAEELDGDTPKEDGWKTEISILVDRIASEELKTQVLFLKKGDSLRFNARDLEATEKEDFYRRYILSIPVGDKREVGDTFQGTITEVSRVEAAEFSEDFFKNYIGKEDITSKEGALEEVKKGILQFYDGRSDALLMRSFQERLMEVNDFPLPEKFLTRWLKLTNEGRISEAQVERELPFFILNLRWTLIRDKIKESFEIFATDEDLLDHFADRIASYFQGQVDRAFCLQMAERFMKDKKELKKAEEDIEWEKLTQVIKQEVSITDKAVPSAEFHAIIEQVSQQAKSDRESDSALRESVEIG